MKLVIEDIKWQLSGIDDQIKRDWENVQRQKRWLDEYKDTLNEALKKHDESIVRKLELHKALEILEAATEE